LTRSRKFIVVAGTALLAACSTAPEPAPAPTPVAEAPAPKPSPYRWTNGFSDKAREAALETFGETALKPGDFLWASDIPAKGDTRIVVDLLTQTAFVYRGEKVVGITTISSGKKGRETPLGFWSVLSKRKMYRSRKYDSAPMPFAQMIDDHGIALHGGKLPGYPASHGCVRLPMKFAERLFGLTQMGSKVVIEG
jgi:lipoprotein-anchoring transpeptidase ErfK/SrfK